MDNNFFETIVAQATPIGIGGVGIVRVSGPNSYKIAQLILGQDIKPRYAYYSHFKGSQGDTIDIGIAIYFKAPHSFTGEDVVEFQGHGGQVVINEIINEILNTKLARIAEPGEFSKQAFINNKIDLVQAEAIADLINASSKEAAKGAINSLNGDFSKLINKIIDKVIYIRSYIESAIDFPDEEIEFLEKGNIKKLLQEVIDEINNIKEKASYGKIINEGINAVIIGKPNAGKSSLMNSLLGEDYAIVTDIAGTTRDILQEKILISGVPLNIVDTAGLRDTNDVVESIGIDRAYAAMDKANIILLVVDNNIKETLSLIPEKLSSVPKIYIHNKIDLYNLSDRIEKINNEYHVYLNARDGIGINYLLDALKQTLCLTNATEGNISARKRHILAIEKAYEYCKNAYDVLDQYSSSELAADDLRLSQLYLSEIGGKFSADDLLTKIFDSFCIGK